MTSVAAFLPDHLARRIGRRGAPPVPHLEERSGALLYCDVSGFTALSEQLSARGREGAETLADVVSRALEPAIRAIERHGGSIVSFGGDSLFAIFPEAPSRAGAGVSRAFTAGTEIQAALAATALEPPASRLEMTLVVHHGTFREYHLGSPAARLHVVAGPEVERLARLELRARPGVVTCSRAAASHPRRLLRASPVRRAAAPRSPALAAYVAPPLRPILGRFEGESCNVAMLFLETRCAALGALQQFAATLLGALARHDGVLLKTDLCPRGIRWLCVLGIPAAHEDDVERAAHLAWSLMASADPRLRVRGGLHHGRVANVVIGTRRRRSFDVMGDAVNVAARALELAEPGEVLVTDACLAAGGGLATSPRGSHVVKGRSAPLRVHALAARPPESAPVRVSAPLVGRQREMATVRQLLEEARSGRGSVVGIRGEPGMGKSRLKWEASRIAAGLGFEVHEGRARATAPLAYDAAADLIGRCIGLEARPERAAILQAVSRSAAALGLPATDRHHLAELLGARYDDSPLPHLDSRTIRHNNLLAGRALLLARSRAAPQLYVLEDMHWSDESSRSLVTLLASGIPGSGAMLMLLYRPGFAPPPGSREMLLEELGAEHVAAMVASLLGPVPAAIAGLVARSSEGNPLYIEELARHFVDAGLLRRSERGYALVRAPGTEDVPPSIEALIKSRLDRLPEGARRLAQIGAVVGRAFDADLVASLAGAGDEPARALEELRAREIVFPHRQGAGSRDYIFKHGLIRDVAYGTILAGRRRRIHAAVAAAIRDAAGPRADASLAALGHHWEEAGRTRLAARAYLDGARRAVRRFAHEEAERLFRSYLGLADSAGPEAIAARNELGSAVLHVRGKSPEAMAEHRRALADAEARCAARARPSRGDRLLVASSRRWLGVIHHTMGQAEEARRLYELALRDAELLGDAVLSGEVHGHLAGLLYDQGRFEEAGRSLAMAQAAHARAGNARGEGAAVANRALLLMEQDRPQEAEPLMREGLRMVRACGWRQAEAQGLGNLAILARKRGDNAEALDLYGLALTAHRATGARRDETICLLNLGLLLHAIDPAQSTSILADALALARGCGFRPLEAEVLANVGVLRLERGEPAMEELAEARAIHREVGNRRAEAADCLHLARAAASRAEPPEPYLEAARSLATESGDALTALRALLLLVPRTPERRSALLDEAEELARRLGAALPQESARELAELLRAPSSGVAPPV